MDRRIQKTRQGLQEALLTLLKEKSLEEIDIKEITDTANTARVTFYRHYGTKEELLIDTIEMIYQEFESTFTVLTAEQTLDFNATPPSQSLFELLNTDRAFYKKLFTGSASAIIQRRMRHYIVQEVTKMFGANPKYANLPLFLIGNHIASVNIGNIMWWLADDLPYSPQYMATITHRIAMLGVMNLVGRGDELIIPDNDEWRSAELY